MAELFSPEWMKAFGEEWNKEPGLAEALGKIGFNSVIAYGFDDEVEPRGVLVVENGKVTYAGPPRDGDQFNWDLRAKKKNWEKWLSKPPGMAGLGMAYTTRKLKFEIGDYTAMIKDPRMAPPFVKSFVVMGRVNA
ncbi:MAG: SCP-2 sterol transfer family protein [Nitrospirae bacterium]|nr:MAG: SCP-2 sterol transfer family protein [Nitrospirota bacterium]